MQKVKVNTSRKVNALLIYTILPDFLLFNSFLKNINITFALLYHKPKGSTFETAEQLPRRNAAGLMIQCSQTKIIKFSNANAFRRRSTAVGLRLLYHKPKGSAFETAEQLPRRNAAGLMIQCSQTKIVKFSNTNAFRRRSTAVGLRLLYHILIDNQVSGFLAIVKNSLRDLLLRLNVLK
ncbi:MAG: hypothetical protein IJN65_05560 [Clostridia bacterium]|nr:hypothetical protein [Clostridia bacterium]